MKHPDKPYFDKLKEEIAARYRTKNPDAPLRIEDWNGKTIEGFQNDLQQEVKSAISLRWFYMHIKSVNEDKIPRTDVLNLLCRYAGYISWEDFIEKKKAEGILPILEDKEESNQGTIIEKKRKRWLSPAVMVVLIVIITGIWAGTRKPTEIHCRFCFVDADFGTSVNNTKINITVLRDKESPQNIQCNDSGCVTLNCHPGKITFIVKAEYYHPDTITRLIAEGFKPETIKLDRDDYAMMISIFSHSDIADFEKRRNQLNMMFTDDAQVIQVSPKDMRGMELYNKEEFIDKMTMPVASLKNIEVIQTVYKGNKIALLRFIQKGKN